MPLPVEEIFEQLSDKQKQQFGQFSEMLQDSKHNVTRIQKPNEIYRRHFLDALAVLPALEEAKVLKDKTPRVIDIGSGAGLPGLALAIVKPAWHFRSIESVGKKTHFQQQVVEKLSLQNVRIFCDRAEDLAHDIKFRKQYALAFARAFAPLPVLLELTLPFLRKGGLLVAWKGPQVSEELPEAKTTAKILGARFLKEILYTLPEASGDSEQEQQPSALRLVLFKKVSDTAEQYPRKPARIRKHPLR